MNKVLFYFDFDFGNSKKLLAFLGDGVDLSRYEEFDDFIMELFSCGVVGEIEGEYGVHDWNVTKNHDYEINAIGFMSDEVKESRVHELIDTWKDFLEKTLRPKSVSKVIEMVGLSEDFYDSDVFNIVENICLKNN
jgi:hypothetical protein